MNVALIYYVFVFLRQYVQVKLKLLNLSKKGENMLSARFGYLKCKCFMLLTSLWCENFHIL